MTRLSTDLRELACEAFLYFYPLMTMEVTRVQQTMEDPEGLRPSGGPSNQFFHMRQYPSAEFRSVVRPNFDTLYSSLFLDLTGGPAVITVPDAGDRYYMLPMLDMWTDVFANPGSRTSGNGNQRVAVVPPGHTGEVPRDADVIEATTPLVWIIGRIQTNGPDDYQAVHQFQDALGIELLGRPASSPPTVAGITPTTEPLAFVNELSASEYFTGAVATLAVSPPHASDYDQLARLRRLGITPGQPWDAARFSAADLDTIEQGMSDALNKMREAVVRLGNHRNGWTTQTETMGVYGNYYLKRAMITLVGLGANPAEDALYPVLLTDADGQPLDGANDYVIHFEAGALPPVDAFWSVTMYDEGGYQVGNELDRFAIGDRDALTYNEDGSLDLYLTHAEPAEGSSNWLPSPTGRLAVTLRLYAPQHEALTGEWAPPAVQRRPGAEPA